ncbi:MAG: hypothetical protein OXD50_08315 [Chloroflexi bacterium]|nr:hypothetical protein [Chloroflexota bacterium]
MAPPTRLSAGLFVVVLAVIGVIHLSNQPAAASEDSFTDFLYPGWNLIGWIEEPTDVVVMFDTLPQLVAIHDGTGNSIHRHDDQALGHLWVLKPGHGYWFEVESQLPVAWQRRLSLANRMIELQAGEQLVAWTGRDDIPIAEALDIIGERLNIAWYWDASTQRFTPWTRTAPFSSLGERALSYGDGILLRMVDSSRWLQPSGALPNILIPDDLDPVLIERIESDIRDAEALFAAEFELPIDQQRITIYVSSDERFNPRVPCCRPPEGWPYVIRQPDGGHHYQLVIPETRWQQSDWRTPDLGAWDGYRELVHMYFRVIQHELSGPVIDSIPRWLVVGTSNSLIKELGPTLQFDFATELMTNQLELSLSTVPGPNDENLGIAYVDRLVRQSHPQSYMTFWRSIDQTQSADVAWRQAFLAAFGVSADEFVSQVNKERRAAFSDVTGPLVGDVASSAGAIRVSASSLLPLIWAEFEGSVSVDGSYTVRVPRNYPFVLEVGVPHHSCGLFLGQQATLVARDEADPQETDQLETVGPTISIPAGFCEQQIAVNVSGSRDQIPTGLRLDLCSPSGESCTRMYIRGSGSFSARVAIPGPRIVKVTSREHVCPSYLSASGLSHDLAGALRLDSAVNPTPATLHFDEHQQFCSVAIRGQFTGRSAQWFDGRTLRAYPAGGGSPTFAVIDADGRFELQVPSLAGC